MKPDTKRVLQPSRLVPTLAAGLALAVSLLLAAPAAATVRHVANNGSDSGGCGSSTNPCRTFTQAIANAAPGDTIRVGPGVYGDLDRDGEYTGPPEELNDGEVRIYVNKQLTFESAAGAGSVVILAGSTYPAVEVAVSGVVFGKPNKGFTILCTNPNGRPEGISAEVDDVTISGNKVIGCGGSAAIYVAGDRATVSRNVVAGSIAWGIQVDGGDGHRVLDNLAVFNGDLVAPDGGGFFLSGSNYSVTGNVASGNADGFWLQISAPSETGPSLFKKNAAIGNYAAGIAIERYGSGTIPPVTLSDLTLYGNGRDDTNCGLRYHNSDTLNPLVINATNVYWGAASGPGANPADTHCSGGGFGTVTPNITNAAAEIKVKPKPLK